MHMMQGYGTTSHFPILETNEAVAKEATQDKGSCIMCIRQFVCQDVDVCLEYSENTVSCARLSEYDNDTWQSLIGRDKRHSWEASDQFHFILASKNSLKT